MNRAEYLKITTAGRANKRRAAPRGPSRESSLARLQRERPEMFSGSYFYAPVKAWKALQHVPQEWSSANFKLSASGTAARERDMQSDDPHTKARAKGDLGGFPIRRFAK